jgi:Zn-dependent protease
MLTGWIDLSLQQLLLRLIAYVFIAGIHGFAVAATAYALGDSGPRHDGRLTVNPLVHLDVLGTAVGVFFSFGWIRPIAVDPAELRMGRAGLVIVVAAGVAATLLAAVALRLLRPLLLPLLSDTAASAAFALVETSGDLSLWFAIFNVLPLPPLTGAHLLVAAVPAWRKVVVKWQLYAALALAVLAATKALAVALGPAYRLLAPAFIGQ